MAYKNPLDERARAARRKHYAENKQQYLDRNAAVKQSQRAWLDEKKSVPCMDCGVRYPPYVMDFDHRDPSQKKANITQLLGRGWKVLKTEVEKCDIVCANCHRERTWGTRTGYA